MSPALHAAGLMTLSFGVPLALAVWELLRPGRDGGRRRHADAPTPRPPSPIGAVPRPLPDCLIPKPLVRRPERVDA